MAKRYETPEAARGWLRLLVLIAGATALAVALQVSSAGAESSGTDLAETDLPYMVLPLADLGDQFTHLQVDPLSGFDLVDDRDVGEIGAYALFYTPADFGGPDGGYPGTVVALYTADAAASSAITAELDTWRGQVEDDGGTVDTFDLADIGDEAIGLTATFTFGGFGYGQTLVVFRTGPLIGVSVIEREDLVDVHTEAMTIAQALLARMQGVLSGDVTALPAFLPPDPNCDGNVDAVDATLVLQLSGALVDSLRCDFLADANGDGRANAVDAALILQFDAGLIERFAQAAASAMSAHNLAPAMTLEASSPRPPRPVLPAAPDPAANATQLSPTPTATTPNGVGAIVVDCDADQPGVQTECSHSTGSTFGVQLTVTEAPAVGYEAFDTETRWTQGVLDYLPASDVPEPSQIDHLPVASQEALWPSCSIPLRVDDRTFVYSPPRPPQPSLHFACVPFPLSSEPSTATGAILQLQFQCLHDGAASLQLMQRDPQVEQGTYFLDEGINYIDPQLTNATVTCTSDNTTLQPSSIATASPTATPEAPPAAPTPVDFSLGIDTNSDGVDDCTSAEPAQNGCSLPQGSQFTLQVYLNRAPSYGGYDVFLDNSGVTVETRAGGTPVIDTSLWPDCAFPANFLDSGSVLFGCAIGVAKPPSTYTGLIATVDYVCTNSGTITMIPGEAVTDVVRMDLTSLYEAAPEALDIDCVPPADPPGTARQHTPPTPDATHAHHADRGTPPDISTEGRQGRKPPGKK